MSWGAQKTRQETCAVSWGPRRFWPHSPCCCTAWCRSQPLVRARSTATMCLRGHHSAACPACSPLPSQSASHMSPEPQVLRVRVPPSWPSVYLAQHTCLCHTCAQTQRPSGPQRPLLRAGSISTCLLCPGPPTRGADPADGEGLRHGEL